MSARDSSQKVWLLKVHSSVEWKLKGPNIQNPFDSSAQDTKLEEYANDRMSLMEVCTVLGLMDDTTIIKITNLDDFTFETNHPNVVGIDREQLEQYVRESTAWKDIQAQFDEFQERCREELERRRSAPQAF